MTHTLAETPLCAVAKKSTTLFPRVTERRLTERTSRGRQEPGRRVHPCVKTRSGSANRSGKACRSGGKTGGCGREPGPLDPGDVTDGHGKSERPRGGGVVGMVPSFVLTALVTTRWFMVFQLCSFEPPRLLICLFPLSMFIAVFVFLL